MRAPSPAPPGAQEFNHSLPNLAANWNVCTGMWLRHCEAGAGGRLGAALGSSGALIAKGAFC